MKTHSIITAATPPPRGKAARKWRRQMRNLKRLWKSVFSKPIEQMSNSELLALGA